MLKRSESPDSSRSKSNTKQNAGPGTPGIHRKSVFWPSTLVENPLQTGLFMQNKPNSLKTKTNATSYTTKDYRRHPPLPHPKKQTQSNPILSHGDQTRRRAHGGPIRHPKNWLKNEGPVSEAHYGSRRTASPRDKSSILGDCRSEMCSRMRSISRSEVQERGCSASVAGRQSPNAPLAGIALITLVGGCVEEWAVGAELPPDL